MILTKISHVVQLLTHLQDKLIESDQKQVDQDSFQEYFKIKSIPVGSEYPNYFESKKFCLNAKLVEEEKNFLHLTKLGENILKNYDSNEKFNTEIIKKCLNNSYFSNILIPILKQFHVDVDNQNKLWFEKEKISKLFPKKTNILQILYDVKFLSSPNNSEQIFINQIYPKNKIIIQNIRNKRKKPQSELEKDLLEQKVIGNFAEKFVLEYEKRRLKKDDCAEKANNVEQISEDWSNAGYDIESFNGEESDDILPDRFIEVKGTRGKEFSIFWSANEIEIAKYHGSKYWIYFVSEIDIITGVPDGKEPEMIPNAYDRIKPDDQNSINDEYFKTTNKIHVTKNE
jgi:hypothetical protein